MKKLEVKTIQRCMFFCFTIALLSIASCNQAQQKPTGETAAITAPSTPITEAAFFGNTEAIKGHIAAKSDLNQKDDYGSTPLHIAATFGKTDVALLLIEAGANLNEKNAEGSTPLHTAAFFGRTEIVKALLANKADISIRNNYQTTALESVSGAFADVKPVYDQFSKTLGPLGLKLDYEQLEASRPAIAELIKASSK
ncbi:ankyrin repeat domain-containing protein [Flammeovirgaceae bacterium SG7u.111]|nr:ankyrin repeat domain-containing protein [Flammeovirgaceae bacterium SG7u.132]WPO37976.1 ankyrin repeat domain-containing protein [Flammeovirgaceae bacterium SG7u.111]